MSIDLMTGALVILLIAIVAYAFYMVAKQLGW